MMHNSDQEFDSEIGLQFKKTFEDIRSAVDPSARDTQFMVKKGDFFEVNSDMMEFSTGLSASTKSGKSTLEQNNSV
jgi:hypothetical protein